MAEAAPVRKGVFASSSSKGCVTIQDSTPLPGWVSIGYTSPNEHDPHEALITVPSDLLASALENYRTEKP